MEVGAFQTGKPNQTPKIKMEDNSPCKSYVKFSPAMIPTLESLVSSPDHSKKPQPTNQLK